MPIGEVEGQVDTTSWRRPGKEEETMVNDNNVKVITGISTYELEVVECLSCGFHLGLDASFLDQVAGVTMKCPGCDTILTVAGCGEQEEM